jgi:hypothetical protein
LLNLIFVFFILLSRMSRVGLGTRR